MKVKATILVCVLAFSLCSGCRMVEILAGSERAGTVDALWPDVPAVDGAKKADLAIPLAARLMIRAAMQGKVNFIAFTSDRSAQAVQGYYTNDRMKAAGWTPSEKGCVGDNEKNDGPGAACFFTRKGQGKDEGLAIIVAEDDKTKQTEIFYARIDITPDQKDAGASGISKS